MLAIDLLETFSPPSCIPLGVEKIEPLVVELVGGLIDVGFIIRPAEKLADRAAGSERRQQDGKRNGPRPANCPSAGCASVSCAAVGAFEMRGSHGIDRMIPHMQAA